MAHMQTTIAPRGNIIANFFESIFNGLMAISEANSRVREIEHLNAKSDEQLANMGLRRTDIARHVFRDRLFM